MKLARMPDGSPEIFHTLQGEGRHTGRPSVFLRASLCNLSCHWCDTPYTWNWEDTDHAHEGGEKYRRDEQILDLSTGAIVEAVSAFPCRNYVFTGGEPLLQERNWVELMAALSAEDPGSAYEVETNGTLLPGAEFLDRIGQCNVSPKLSNSRVPEELRCKPDVLRGFAATGKADFKFVAGEVADLAEILDLVDACELPRDRVFLMPRARTVAELDETAPVVAKLALDNGFRFSDRLHLRLYGAKRGT